jgi:hypothetical protein
MYTSPVTMSTAMPEAVVRWSDPNVVVTEPPLEANTKTLLV